MKLAPPLLSATLAKLAPPSRNVTVPEAVEGVTAARSVTGWPEEAGLGETEMAMVELVLPTARFIEAELVANVLSPLNVADRICVPDGRVDVAKVAIPPLTVPDPRVVPEPLSTNLTVPVAPEGVSLAVRVTACPKLGLAGDAESVKVVGVRFEDRVTGLEVDGKKFGSPLYLAVTEWPPDDNAELVKTALPDTTVAVPIVADPSVKVTVPVKNEANPTTGADSLAVNVTAAGLELAGGEETESTVVVGALLICTWIELEVLGGSPLLSPEY